MTQDVHTCFTWNVHVLGINQGLVQDDKLCGTAGLPEEIISISLEKIESILKLAFLSLDQ